MHAYIFILLKHTIQNHCHTPQISVNTDSFQFNLVANGDSVTVEFMKGKFTLTSWIIMKISKRDFKRKISIQMITFIVASSTDINAFKNI